MKNDALPYFACLIRSNGGFLLCRFLDGSSGVPGNYHFPGGQLKSIRDVQKQAVSIIKAKYGGDIEVFAKLAPSRFLLGDGKIESVILLFARELTPLVFRPGVLSSAFLTKKGIENEPLDYADRFLFRKGEAYYPVVKAPIRVTPLSVENAKKAMSMEESLSYFGKRIPKQRAAEFRLSLTREVPYEAVLDCYKLLLEECKLDYNEYLSFVKAKRASYAE